MYRPVVDNVAVARSLRGSIGMLAMDWLMSPATLDAATAAGMPEGLAGYVMGRFGGLGACPPDNVVAAAYFWEPSLLSGLVAEGRAAVSPNQGAAIYTEICQDWGERHLGGFEGVERLGELCERVVSGASPLHAPTFVAWRDQPLPAVGPGRTFQLCQIMRELRFGRHCVAVTAAGMGPLEAILSGPSGEWNAEMFGWTRPYPDVSGFAGARESVESATDRLHAADVSVLESDERAELRDLAKAARSHATARP